MLEQIEDFVINQGLDEIRTTSSITAKAFYERNGFIKDGPAIMVGNIEGDFPLIKKLSPNKPLSQTE